MTALLEFRDVRARYGLARILDGVSLTLRAGEILAVVGRNGAGKTTALHAVFGIPDVDGGEILVEGQRLHPRHPYEAARRGVAIAPQGRRILSNLTVEENLLLGTASRRRGRWTLPAVYDLFPILGERRRQAGTLLSGGQQQMLTIGRALLANPVVLLLDEPTEGLAPVMVDQLAETVTRLRAEGVALLLVEQHLDLVTAVSDRYVVLEKGRSVAHGRMAEMDPAALRSVLAI